MIWVIKTFMTAGPPVMAVTTVAGPPVLAAVLSEAVGYTVPPHPGRKSGGALYSAPPLSPLVANVAVLCIVERAVASVSAEEPNWLAETERVAVVSADTVTVGDGALPLLHG